MTVFCHVLSKELSSCANKLLNDEEKCWEQSVNPCRHLMRAWEQTDVAVVVSVTLRVHNMMLPQAAKQCAV